MKLRPIERRDDPQLYALIRQILKSENLDIPGTAYYDEALSALTDFYEQTPNAKYFVIADKNDKVYGGVGIAPFSGKICELQKLYLLPEARGQGYAQELMEAALDFARQHYQKIYLETHSSLTRALALYEKYDFQKLPAPLEGSEHSAMDTWLIKDLTLVRP